MVAWAEYKAQAKARGALALELFVAQSTPAKPPEEVKAVLPDHLAYQAELERDGRLAFAGPLSDEAALADQRRVLRFVRGALDGWAEFSLSRAYRTSPRVTNRDTRPEQADDDRDRDERKSVICNAGHLSAAAQHDPDR